MSRRGRDHYTQDLLSWRPPEPVVKFADDQVRAATLDQRLCKAMVLALKECRLDRGVVAIKEVELAEKRDEIIQQLQLTRMKRRSGGR